MPACAPARPRMAPGPDEQLCALYRAGDPGALERLLERHRSLVARVARRYVRRGVAPEDLASEGTIGLLRAARKFDPRFGLAFLPYAIWWVKQAMIMHVIQHGQGAIALPIRKVQLQKRLRREQEILKSTLGRDPTPAELARETGKGEAEVRDALQLTPEFLAWEDHLADTAGDGAPPGVHPAEAAVDRRRLRDELETLVRELPQKDQAGLRLYFGLDGGFGMNFATLGRSLCMTREGARQMIKRSLGRLRSDPRSLGLSAWL